MTIAPHLLPLFWAKVNKDGPVPEFRPDLGQCWLWTGHIKPEGYGQYRDVGRVTLRLVPPSCCGLWNCPDCRPEYHPAPAPEPPADMELVDALARYEAALVAHWDAWQRLFEALERIAEGDAA